MSAARHESLRAARQNPSVLLQRYNTRRSHNAGGWICVFEGPDDVPFYSSMIHTINPELTHAPFVCNGKAYVLQLRNMLARNVAAGKHLVRFFIDHDFDGLKGHPAGDDLYVTPCYSIENLLVSRATLRKLLDGEYKCHDDHAGQDISKIDQLFEARLQEFIDCMREANRLLFSARTNGVTLKPVENDIGKYLQISLERVSVSSYQTSLPGLIGYDAAPDPQHLAASQAAFDSLDPVRQWRGKFLFAFFRKFLALLKEDRGTKSPLWFVQRANMTFDPNGEIIRCLAATVMPPDCLRQFVSSMAH